VLENEYVFIGHTRPFKGMKHQTESAILKQCTSKNDDMQKKKELLCNTPVRKHPRQKHEKPVQGVYSGRAQDNKSIPNQLINNLLTNQSGWHAGLPIERSRVEIPARAEIWFEISAPPVHPSQLSDDEYTDHTPYTVSGKMRR